MKKIFSIIYTKYKYGILFIIALSFVIFGFTLEMEGASRLTATIIRLPGYFMILLAFMKAYK